MKALLICPGRRSPVATLLESGPLVTLPLLGKCLLEYWLEHLVEHKVNAVHILASDRPENVLAMVEDGARWGLQVTVLSENSELSIEEAWESYGEEDQEGLFKPDRVVVLDHLPGSTSPLFESYAGFFAALLEWMPRAATPDRIGMRELRPGIWVGLHSYLSPQAQLCAPCWIGEDVHVGPRAIIGPGAILESRTFVDSDAEIVESVVGAATLVGKRTEVRHSIVEGPTLVNWQLNSCVRVRDAFLLSGLEPYSSRFERGNIVGRLMALLALILFAPFALVAALRSRRCGAPVLRTFLAARPCAVAAEIVPGDTIVYHKLADVDGIVGRWPQLWNVVCGEFTWVGNRPLNPHQAANLTSDYERLWLAAPIGLLCLADAEGCPDSLSDEARAHASYYAARAGRRLDLAILLRMMFLLVVGVPWSRQSETISQTLRALRVGGRSPAVNENSET
jgi:hypothetical protein